MAKRNSGVDMKAGKAGQPALKGLERRTRQGRRATPRRKSEDSTPAAERPAAAPESLPLASEAGTRVARCYEELFSLFPGALAASMDPNATDRQRKRVAAVNFIVAVLRRQDERVDALKQLAPGNQDTARLLQDLMTDFSSDAWNNAFKLLRETVSG